MPKTTGNPYGLTDLQVRFCQEYAKSLNGTQAYLRAGYSVSNNNVARAAASRLLANVNIKTYLGEIVNLSEVSVVSEITKIAFANITDVIDVTPNSISLKSIENLSDRARSSIQSISITETETKNGKTTTVQVKMHDKLAALEKLMKKLKLYPKDISVVDAIQLLLSEGVATNKQAEIVLSKIEEMQSELGSINSDNH